MRAQLLAVVLLVVPQLAAAQVKATSAVDSLGRSKKTLRAPSFIATQDPAGAVTIYNAPFSSPYSVTAKYLNATDPASVSTIAGPAHLGVTTTGTLTTGPVTTTGNAVASGTITATGGLRGKDLYVTDPAAVSSILGPVYLTTVSASRVAVLASVDVATIGTAELLTNGGFTGSAAGWSLAGFTYSGNAIGHDPGAVGTASQTITLKAYTTYRLAVTLTTATRGWVGFYHNGTPLLDADLWNWPTHDVIGYPFDVEGGAGTYVFDVEFRSVAAEGSAAFAIQASADWGGTIDNVSLIEVREELPFAFLSRAADDTPSRIPSGLKFGRFNAGNLYLGDRQVGALTQSAGVWNVGIGARALSSNETGFENVAVGAFALKYNSQPRNTALGYSAAKLNTTGIQLTALGYKASVLNTTGNYNTSVGFHAGFQNTSGDANTAVGNLAMYGNLAGGYTTALGHEAGLNFSGGTANTYVGALAGYLNSDASVLYTYSYGTMLGSETKVYGDYGTAGGWLSKVGTDPNAAGTTTAYGTAYGARTVVTSSEGIAVGYNAQATTAQRNIAIGTNATAVGNEQAIAIGYSADADGGYATVLGGQAGTNQTGAGNTFVGWKAGNAATPQTYLNVSAVGASAAVDRSNMVQLGDTAVTVLRVGTHRITWSAAAPVSGTWGQGDVAWNTGATAGGAPGWVCTAAGTPGTWKAMANLAP
jgi:hypothetical protein